MAQRLPPRRLPRRCGATALRLLMRLWPGACKAMRPGGDLQCLGAPCEPAACHAPFRAGIGASGRLRGWLLPWHSGSPALRA